LTYIAPLSAVEADIGTAATLAAVKARIGMVPNLYATLAKAPAALNALLATNEAIAAGSLTAPEREIVALATSQLNGCQYCLSAHTALGNNAGLSLEQTRLARAGQGADARAAAIAAFSQAVVEQRGHVSEQSLDGFKRAGLSERDLLEIVANVAATTYTNYVNNVARTAIDFPVVATQLAA
jgi:uncharacterized peroxidase-related enzyme